MKQKISFDALFTVMQKHFESKWYLCCESDKINIRQMIQCIIQSSVFELQFSFWVAFV